jgi:hypothetical protein
VSDFGRHQRLRQQWERLCGFSLPASTPLVDVWLRDDFRVTLPASLIERKVDRESVSVVFARALADHLMQPQALAVLAPNSAVIRFAWRNGQVLTLLPKSQQQQQTPVQATHSTAQVPPPPPPQQQQQIKSDSETSPPTTTPPVSGTSTSIDSLRSQTTTTMTTTTTSEHTAPQQPAPEMYAIVEHQSSV